MSAAPEHDPSKLAAAADGMEIRVPPEWLDPEQNKSEHFEVWPKNWPAVDLFIRCQTQWHWRPDGRRGGMIYSELIAMGKLFSVANLKQVVADVQVIEIEILSQEAQR